MTLTAACPIHVPEVTDLDIAFGTTEGLPDYKEIPDEFKGLRNDGWCGLVSGLFCGQIEELELTPKPNVDPLKAFRHIRALLCSFEPKHEHKTAGCAYLLSKYFASASWQGGRA